MFRKKKKKLRLRDGNAVVFQNYFMKVKQKTIGFTLVYKWMMRDD